MAKKDEENRNENLEGARPQFLETDEIERLIGILSDAGGLELELEHGESRLRIRIGEVNARTEVLPVAVGSFPQGAAAPVAGLPMGDAAPAKPADQGPPPGTEYFTSPMVGTFYRAPSPESDSFVQNGDKVGPETTLCIIEAMKVMNEIKAEQNAEIVEALVENGAPVEFGQPLFLLKKL